MPRGGRQTKDRILDVAEKLVLDHGLGSTSIDQILLKAGITKGAFFYHFKSKSELARALLNRYVERDDQLLESLMRRAEGLSRDPLQQVLIFVGLLEEMLRGLDQAHPGCIVASYLYQLQEFDVDTREAVRRGFVAWQQALSAKLRQALQGEPAGRDVDPVSLADNLLSALEGGMILAKLYDQPKAVAEQLRHYRNYLELLFGQ